MAFQLMNNIIINLEACLKEVVKPGYSFKVHIDGLSDHIYVKVYNQLNNTYQMVTIPAEIFHYTPNEIQAFDQIINTLAIGTSAFDILPAYLRNFERLMHQLLYSEYTPGKLY